MTDRDRPDTVVRTLGELLRAAREGAGRSVDDVSAATRIRATLVRDLEADDLASSGGAVYSRGHVKAIARALDVDSAPLVAQHDRQAGVSAPPPSRPVPVPSPRAGSAALPVPVPVETGRRNPRWLVAGTAGAAVLVALLAVGTAGGDQRETTVASGNPTAAPAAPSRPPAPKPAKAAAPRPAGAVVALRTTGTSYVRVSAGGRTLFERVVPAGWSQSFSHPERVRVRVGNAAAVQVSCAGSPAAAAGTEGAVLTLTCTPGGLLRP